MLYSSFLNSYSLISNGKARFNLEFLNLSKCHPWRVSLTRPLPSALLLPIPGPRAQPIKRALHSCPWTSSFQCLSSKPHDQKWLYFLKPCKGQSTSMCLAPGKQTSGTPEAELEPSGQSIQKSWDLECSAEMGKHRSPKIRSSLRG